MFVDSRLQKGFYISSFWQNLLHRLNSPAESPQTPAAWTNRVRPPWAWQATPRATKAARGAPVSGWVWGGRLGGLAWVVGSCGGPKRTEAICGHSWEKSQKATRNKCHASSNKCLTSRNNKASLLVTSALWEKSGL